MHPLSPAPARIASKRYVDYVDGNLLPYLAVYTIAEDRHSRSVSIASDGAYQPQAFACFGADERSRASNLADLMRGVRRNSPPERVI